ncbi:unnamed protein product [Symbiodinium natans]|uniref:Uncharacterized protein n=1 Tax=Symbiodinium natans TaxID=878477 RepID=A0A812I3Q8_9DINO|nr:unnamed protein product [Symbiodinium natans]
MPAVVLVPRVPGPVNALGFHALRPRLRSRSPDTRECDHDSRQELRQHRRHVSTRRKDRHRALHRNSPLVRPHAGPRLRSCSRRTEASPPLRSHGAGVAGVTSTTEEDSHDSHESHEEVRRPRRPARQARAPKRVKERRRGLRHSTLRPRPRVSARVRGLQQDHDLELLTKNLLPTRRTRDERLEAQAPCFHALHMLHLPAACSDWCFSGFGEAELPASMETQTPAGHGVEGVESAPAEHATSVDAAAPTGPFEELPPKATSTAVEPVAQEKGAPPAEACLEVPAAAKRLRRPRWWRPRRPVVPAAVLQLQELCREMKAERRALCKVLRAEKDGPGPHGPCGVAAELRQCWHDLKPRLELLASRAEVERKAQRVLTAEHEELQLAYAKLLAGPGWKPRLGALRPQSTSYPQSGGGDGPTPESDDDVIIEEDARTPKELPEVTTQMPTQAPPARPLSEEREEEARAKILARAVNLAL